MRFNIQVSVIMPCFNAEDYLIEAINSILGQSLGNLELIIVNDGSTDNTEMLVSGFSDKRIRYLSLGKNQGNYVARNKGLDLAKGKYIAMADADDISLPERLQTQCEFLEANPNVVAIGSRMKIINQEEECIHLTEGPLVSEYNMDKRKIHLNQDIQLTVSTRKLISVKFALIALNRMPIE